MISISSSDNSSDEEEENINEAEKDNLSIIDNRNNAGVEELSPAYVISSSCSKPQQQEE